MSDKKKLGRPKIKNKAKDAEWLFGERISAEDKRKLEMVRMACRCHFYHSDTHGQTPTALPKVPNKKLLQYIIHDSHGLAYGLNGWARDLESMLRKKGCLNAAELLGLPEGPEQ